MRSRAGHHLRHGRERHLDISLRALPSVRHQDKRRRLTSADIKPAVQCSCRCRSRFMQLPTSAPTGHQAAPDIRDISPRLPWRMSSSSCSCAMETRTRSRGCRFRSRCVQDMEDILPTWSRLTSGQAPLSVHAARPSDMEELPTAGRTSGCAIWTRSRLPLQHAPMLQLN